MKTKTHSASCRLSTGHSKRRHIIKKRAHQNLMGFFLSLVVNRKNVKQLPN